MSENTERDELADVIERAYDLNKGMASFELLAHATLAAGYRKPRTITTVEELDALPVGSTVLSDDVKHHEGGWAISYQRWQDGDWHRGARSGSTHPDNFLPATVLHTPGASL